MVAHTVQGGGHTLLLQAAPLASLPSAVRCLEEEKVPEPRVLARAGAVGVLGFLFTCHRNLF